jgi:hypothetical protein
MAKPRKRRKNPEREEAPQGRDTPVIGPRDAPSKVGTLDGEPEIARPYDSNGSAAVKDEDPWQDPGGAEPANG